MIKRSFFGIAAPRFSYEVIEEAAPQPMDVMPAKHIILLVDAPLEKAGDLLLKAGDAAARGQRLQLSKNNPALYAISPAAGKIVSVEPFIGMMEKSMTAVTIELDKSGEQTQDTAAGAMKWPFSASRPWPPSALPARPGNCPWKNCSPW
jgi:Na+-translocating ferredoxin:NAD+ oxidoreductase RnfC subunit